MVQFFVAVIFRAGGKTVFLKHVIQKSGQLRVIFFVKLHAGSAEAGH